LVAFFAQQVVVVIIPERVGIITGRNIEKLNIEIE
jgi:hypothetical protein